MSQPTSSIPPSPAARIFHGRRSSDLRTMGGLLALIAAAALIGFQLALALPPWQHYDETVHFETAKLIADRLELPTQNEFDPHVRRQIMGSMVEFGFFHDDRRAAEQPTPNLLLTPNPTLGYSQIDGQPLYYVLIAVPIRLAAELGYDIVMQLYAARLFSSLHLIVVVIAAFCTAGELFGAQSRMRWVLPIAVLATPAFTDSMSGLNNDAAAAAIGSLLVWMCARICRRGWTLRRAAVFFVLTAAAVVTKSTILAVLPFCAVLFALHSRVPLRIIVIAIGALVAIAAATLVDGNGAADWLSSDGTITRAAATNGPAGGFAFEAVRNKTQSVSMQQRISLPSLRPGVQAIYTLGAWIWTDGISDTLSMPLVVNPTTDKAIENLVQVDGTPRWFTATITLQNDWRQGSIVLMAPSGAGRLYFDDVRMVAGNDLEAGIDLVANGSAEEPALRLRNTTTRLESVLLFDPGRSFGLLQSERHRDRYLWRALQNILDSFWARFGWGNVGLDESMYAVLTAASLLSFLLSAVQFVRATPAERRILAALWFGAVVMWLFIALRGVGSNLDLRWLPSARYGMPGVLITWLLLLSGWHALIARLPRIAGASITIAWAGLLLALNASSYATVRNFYDEFAADSFVAVHNSQQEWRDAREAIARNDVSAAMEQMRSYMAQRKRNIYAPYAAAEMLVPACAANRSEPLCAAAVAEWKNVRGTTSDALRRSEAELAGRSRGGAGWVELASRLYDPSDATVKCMAWRIGALGIVHGYTATQRLIEPADVHPLDTVVPGSELHGWQGTNTCRGSLKGGEDDRWANLYANGRAAAILDIPADGPYVVTATMATRADAAIGALTIDDQVVSEYKVSQSRTQPQHFEWKVNLEAGMHVFMFSFTNDINLSYLQRDLYIREFSVFEEKAAAD